MMWRDSLWNIVPFYRPRLSGPGGSRPFKAPHEGRIFGLYQNNVECLFFIRSGDFVHHDKVITLKNTKGTSN
jgi:hypothetical protein